MKNKLTFLAAVLASVFFLACAPKEQPLPSIALTGAAIQEMRGFHGHWIEIQIPQRRLVLAKGDKVIKVFPVAVGLPKYPTPTGNRKVTSIVWNPWWTPPAESDWVKDPTPVSPRSKDNPLGEIKMPLGNAYLIHGTKSVDSIGTWASHGCVRMLYEDIFGLVQVLMTHYSKANAVDTMERANKNPTEEFSTALNREVPVVLTYETVKVKDGFVTVHPDFYRNFDDHAEHVAKRVRPFLKGKPNEGRIRSLLKSAKNKTLHVELKTLEE